jgi:hypothetical protein
MVDSLAALNEVTPGTGAGSIVGSAAKALPHLRAEAKQQTKARFFIILIPYPSCLDFQSQLYGKV